MNEQKFEELWGRAEAEGYAARLASEYQGWRTKTRRTMGLVVSLTLVIAVATPVLMPRKVSNTNVFCNHNATTEQYWVDLADELLLG